MADKQTHEEFKALRDAAFRDPTEAKARAFWDSQHFPPPLADDMPLAAVHKYRLQWLDATDEMLAESAGWLREHGYRGTMREAEPLTPETRDRNRASLGKPPLGRAG